MLNDENGKKNRWTLKNKTSTKNKSNVFSQNRGST